MLVVENLVVRYGPITAVRGVSIEVGAGETVALLGPNGAGKTSIVSAVIGLVPSTGRVSFDGRDVSALSPEERVRAAMTVVPEGRRVFANLTVAENLRLGGFVRRRDGDLDQERDRYLAMFPVLRERLDQLAGTLSGGEQQMLAIARAMMSKPRLLILDEPSLGLAPRIVARIFEHIVELKKSGITIVLVEQNMMQALSVADRAYVLSTGSIRHAGPAAELRADPRLPDLAIGGH
jgi:branched-chain amino acid transport system ATP-binding protein